jgi:hypothetical protein
MRRRFWEAKVARLTARLEAEEAKKKNEEGRWVRR